MFWSSPVRTIIQLNARSDGDEETETGKLKVGGVQKDPLIPGSPYRAVSQV